LLYPPEQPFHHIVPSVVNKGAASGGLLVVGEEAERRNSDTGLKELAALKRLRQLDLRRTKATDAGVKGLAKALPGCRIIR
jgi:hypothetical protein